MSKYDNKYRVETTRLKEWDYSTPWWYYVTINTKDHTDHFGKVKNGKMNLNDLGEIVEEEWLKTKVIRTNVELDYFVIMPNHFHGIIILNDINVETCRGKSLQPGVSLQNKLQQQNKSQFSEPIKNSLSVIINQFKGSVKRRANKNGYELFFWQPRFYDRIIRNEKELYNIRKYIDLNPFKWELEKDELKNIYQQGARLK